MSNRFTYFVPLALVIAGCGAPEAAEGEDYGTSPDVEDAPSVDSTAPEVASDVVIEHGTLEQLEASAEEVRTAELPADIQKSCARPLGFHSEKILAEMNMGFWPIHDPHCRDTVSCPNGTYAFSISLKSVAHQGSGDDLAVTGIAIGCNNPITGQFIKWAVPLASAQAPGSWDNSGACSIGSPLWGGNFKLVTGPTSGVDDVGITDGAGNCSNGVAQNVDVNNPAWGSWQGWKNCPSGKRVCGVTQKIDPDDSVDDAGMTGVMVECCDYE